MSEGEEMKQEVLVDDANCAGAENSSDDQDDDKSVGSTDDMS